MTKILGRDVQQLKKTYILCPLSCCDYRSHIKYQMRYEGSCFKKRNGILKPVNLVLTKCKDKASLGTPTIECEWSECSGQVQQVVRGLETEA